MNARVKSRIIAAILLLIIITLLMSLFMDFVGRSLLSKRGKDVYLAERARSYDRMMTHSTPVVLLLFGNVLTFGIVIRAYELLALGIFKLMESHERKHLTNRSSQPLPGE
jgi:hypothetical protein